jgi:general secretion pathway protein K
MIPADKEKRSDGRGNRAGRRLPWDSDKGIALPLVLWVLTVMGALVFSFAFVARTETLSTINFRESTEKKLLAEAGIERGVMEIYYRNFFSGQTQGPAAGDLRIWRTDGTVYREALGKGFYAVSIMDESGKISINGLTDVNGIVLKNLLLQLGSTPENADMIVDSILDWKDADELRRLNGAEREYYMSLPSPYKAKNADFDTIEELLLVRGMTPDILFGDRNKKGLAPFITVLSKQAGINIVAAPREVLLSVPGMTESAVQAILAYREATPVQSVVDIQGLIGDIYTAVAPYLSAASLSMFTITSVGQKSDEKRGYAIVATVIPEQAGRYRTLYYKSPSEIDQ